MRFRDKTQMEAVTAKFRNCSNFRVTKRGKTKPVLITGIWRGYEEEEDIKKMITEENEDVQQRFGGRFATEKEE